MSKILILKIPKKILITGASGFLGFALLKEILANGDEPIVLARESSDLEKIIQLHVEIIFYEKLCDPNLVNKILHLKPVIFIQCGWLGVRGIERNNAAQLTYNIPLTIDSIELANQLGCKQWVGIGSQAEYGIKNRAIDETMTLEPVTTYGKAKVAAYWTAKGLCDYYGIKMLWSRVFSLYGPGDQNDNFIPYIVHKILQKQTPKLTKCEQKWDFLYIDDAAKLIFSLIEIEAVGIYNIGYGKATKLKSVAEMIRKHMKSDIKLNYGALEYNDQTIVHLEADMNKVYNLIKWKPMVKISDGIKLTIDSIYSKSI